MFPFWRFPDNSFILYGTYIPDSYDVLRNFIVCIAIKKALPLQIHF